MKSQRKLTLGFLILLFVSASFGQPASIANFTEAVYYVPPANFHLHDYGIEEPGDLFKYRGSGVQYETLNERDTILFMLEPSDYFDPHLNGKFPGPLFP